MLLKNQCRFRSQSEGTPPSQPAAVVLQAELDGNPFSRSVAAARVLWRGVTVLLKQTPSVHAHVHTRARMCTHTCTHMPTLLQATCPFRSHSGHFATVEQKFRPERDKAQGKGVVGELPQRSGEQKLRWMLAAV